MANVLDAAPAPLKAAAGGLSDNIVLPVGNGLKIPKWAALVGVGGVVAAFFIMRQNQAAAAGPTVTDIPAGDITAGVPVQGSVNDVGTVPPPVNTPPTTPPETPPAKKKKKKKKKAPVNPVPRPPVSPPIPTLPPSNPANPSNPGTHWPPDPGSLVPVNPPTTPPKTPGPGAPANPRPGSPVVAVSGLGSVSSIEHLVVGTAPASNPKETIDRPHVDPIITKPGPVFIPPDMFPTPGSHPVTPLPVSVPVPVVAPRLPAPVFMPPPSAPAPVPAPVANPIKTSPPISIPVLPISSPAPAPAPKPAPAPAPVPAPVKYVPAPKVTVRPV